MPTHRMADQDRRAKAPACDDRVKVRNVVARSITPLEGPFAVAMTALIERENMMGAEQRRRDEVPPASVRRAAMNQQRRRLPGTAIIDAVEHDTVGTLDSQCLHHRS